MADVFISHSSKDHAIAEHICNELEKKGLKCWMAPRDIKPGEEWARAINTAITSSGAFIVIYSSNSAQSTQVPREIGLAGAKNSYIIPYKIDDTKLSDEFEYYLLGSHWVIADLSTNDFKIDELQSVILSAKAKKISAAANIDEESGTTVNNFNVTEIRDSNVTYTTPDSKGKSKLAIIISCIAAALVLVCTVVIVCVFSSQQGQNAGLTDSQQTNSKTSQTTTAIPEPVYTQLCFNFIENDVIHRYDVTLYINDTAVCTIEHGKTEFVTLPYSEGTYNIKVVQIGKTKNYDSKTVTLTAKKGYGYTFDIRAGWTGVYLEGGEMTRF